MVSDFETNKIYFSKRLKSDKRFEKVYSQIISSLDKFGITPRFLENTNDIWARDYMPIQVSNHKFIEYRYDPDYLQGSFEEKGTRELKSYPDIICNTIGLSTIKSNIILDGGNVVKSGNSIILTDKIIWENQRQFTEKQLIKKLHEVFEVEQVVLVPWDEECEFGHADGMLRFMNADTVLISGFYEQVDAQFKSQILRSLEKAKLNFQWLRCSKNEVVDNISYINFLQTKDVLILPSLNKLEDDVALFEISKYFPEYAKTGKIIQVDVREVARYGGALNCISWTKKE